MTKVLIVSLTRENPGLWVSKDDHYTLGSSENGGIFAAVPVSSLVGLGGVCVVIKTGGGPNFNSWAKQMLTYPLNVRPVLFAYSFDFS